MYAPERQALLAERLDATGRLSVADLAEELGVSSETVRRDLAVLERHGLARRVHGGAVQARTVRAVETGVSERVSENAAEKNRIALAALEFLPPTGGSVIADAGTTVMDVIAHLPADRELNVITHSVHTSAALAVHPQVALHVIGGRVRGVTGAAVGTETTNAYAEVNADVVLLGANGLDPVRGFTTPDYEESAVKRAIVGAGRRVVALVDSSKLDLVHLFCFAKVGDVDVVVTDSDATDAQRGRLRETGLEVVIA